MCSDPLICEVCLYTKALCESKILGPVCCEACSHVTAPEDILQEVSDPTYIKLTHGKRSTYADGCHGPLCKKSERDEGANRYRRKMARQGKTTREITKSEEARSRDVILDKYQLWHEWARAQAKSDPNYGVDTTEQLEESA